MNNMSETLFEVILLIIIQYQIIYTDLAKILLSLFLNNLFYNLQLIYRFITVNYSANKQPSHKLMINRSCNFCKYERTKEIKINPRFQRQRKVSDPSKVYIDG